MFVLLTKIQVDFIEFLDKTFAKHFAKLFFVKKWILPDVYV